MAAPTTPPAPITFGKALGGRAGVPILWGIEGTTQSYKAGSPLIFSSGTLVAATSPLSSSNLCIGFAAADASGTTGAKAPYHPAIVGLLWEGTLTKTASTNALVATNIGLIYAITKDTVSGNWYLEATATATDGGLVWEARDISQIGNAVTGVDARVYFALTRPQVLGG